MRTPIHVVTGAGSGIGSAVVQTLLDEDPRLVVAAIDVSQSGLDTLVDQHRDRVDARRCDVTEASAVHNVIGDFAEGGDIVGLVNAAGNHSLCDSIDLSPDELRRVLAVHVDASLFAAQAAARAMIAQGHGGAIVNFSSVAGAFAWPGRLPYAVAKAGVDALTRTLAVEWAPHGIRVNAIAPGYVNTPMVRAAGDRGAFDVEERRRMHALERFAEPHEVAQAVRFLLGGDASFITGEVLRVDGGFSVKR